VREQKRQASVFSSMRISLLWLCLSFSGIFPAASTRGQTARPFREPSRAETAKPKDTHSFASAVDAAAPNLLREYVVPGAAIALIQNGRVVWMRGYGFANLASGTHVTAETVFNVGSISKSPTAWAVMQLVDQGKVDLDRPVDSYLHRWHLPASSFDNGQVTVRRLLSHTSGISNHDFHGWDPESPLPPIEDSLSGKTGTGEVRVVAAPGSGFHYSGANYTILQLLIEEVSGERFQDYMRANIFRPLHMSNSQYGLPPKFQQVMATPYDGLESVIPILRYNELSAAGLTTTLRDLTKFAAAGLQGPAGEEPAGRGVVKGQSIAQMQSPAPNSQWADRDPFGPQPQYGFGYTVRPAQFAGKVGIGHGGSNRGWESFYQIVPSTGDGIVIMTNSSNGGAFIASLLCSWRRWGAGSTQVECPNIDIRAVLYGTYRSKGVKKAVERYRELYQNAQDKYDFGVLQLNSMGYELLRNGDTKGAVEIFRLNVEQFPTDANEYDSLGEAYLKQGDKALGIENYKKSLDLNPQNDNARDVLKKLEVPSDKPGRPGRGNENSPPLAGSREGRIRRR
jgi:CubicO group peptidase (beta-lactamase class C family)